MLEIKKFSDNVLFNDLSLIKNYGIILKDAKGIKFEVKSVLPLRMIVVLQDDFADYKKGDEIIGFIRQFNEDDVISFIPVKKLEKKESSMPVNEYYLLVVSEKPVQVPYKSEAADKGKEVFNNGLHKLSVSLQDRLDWQKIECLEEHGIVKLLIGAELINLRGIYSK